MPSLKLLTDRLELRPLPVRAAAVLPEDRDLASRGLGASLAPEWPASDLVGVLRRHAGLAEEEERFGIWVMIERSSVRVIGDLGFRGPPDDAGSVEPGYSVVPSRRGHGYATEAATALVAWAREQPGVELIVAGCDPANLPSIRTLERSGFRCTGEANGEVRWRYGLHDDM